jgi:hypothetical protein
MTIWRLIPVDLAASHWRATIYKGPLVVRAASEQQARELARQDFAPAGGSRDQPWSCPEVVRAEVIDDPHYPDAGAAEILELS